MCVVAKFDLVFGRFAVVLDVSAFEVAVECFEIEEGRDVGVRGWTVVALVEVVDENFPVVGPCKSGQHELSRDSQVSLSHLPARRCIQAHSRRS